MAAIVLMIDLILVAMAIALTPPAQLLNNAIDIWVDRNDPTIVSYEKEQTLFGNGSWIAVNLWADSPVAAEDASRFLTEAFRQLEAVTSVLSPHALAVLQSDEEGLFFDALDADTPWIERHDFLSKHPLAKGLLVIRDSPNHVGFLLEEFTEGASGGLERQLLLGSIQELIQTQSGLEAHTITGTAVINAELNRLSGRDIAILTPITVLIVLGLAAVLFWRSIRVVLTIATVSGLAIGGTLAGMLATGMPFNMLTIALPGVLFALGMAAGLHVCQFMATSVGTTAQTVRALARPLSVSHLTTALGFLLMGLISVPPVQTMAIWGAIGVSWSGIHMLIVLPTVLRLLGGELRLPSFAVKGWASALITRLTQFRARPIMARLCLAIGAGALVFGVLRIEVDATYLDMFGPDEKLRQDFTLLDDKGLPGSQLSIVITSTYGGAITPELHSKLQNLGTELRAIPELRVVLDPMAIYAEVAPALKLDDANAQEAYIFALTGGSRDVQRYLQESLQHFRIVVMFDYMANSKLRALVDEQIAPAIQRSGLIGEVSGLSLLWANLDLAITRGQGIALLLFTLVCASLFMLVFRDVRLALLGTLVNLVPVATIAATLGISGIAIDMGTVFILSLLFGIAIDDTSFFIDALQRENGELATTLHKIAPPILLTSLLLSSGFLVLWMSSFVPIQFFGLFTALGILGAAISDIVILTTLLIRPRESSAQ